MLTLQDIIDRWNAQSDEYNQWDNLSGEEMAKWVYEIMGKVEFKLRRALIDIARTSGGTCSDEVSTEFLYQVPDKIKMILKKKGA
jgi:hypothetical protein